MTLKFNSNYNEWKRQYETEPVYTRKQLQEALTEQAKELTVNRVVWSRNGLYGPDCSQAMQILAIHRTPEGTLVIVR